MDRTEQIQEVTSASSGALSIFFGCSACGKCCNSPPRLLLPELFRHRARFLGLLGVERRGNGFELFVHGFGFAASSACPALGADGACAVHFDGKPSVCQLVPLDASLLDTEQASLLTARSADAGAWGADCIRSSPQPGFREVTRGLRVVDPESEALLAAHRMRLSEERRFWRDATSALMARELTPASVPRAGALSLSLVPALAVLAGASEPTRQQVATFMDAQNALAAELVDEALARKRREDRADTSLLRAVLASGRTFRAALERPVPSPARHAPSFIAELERWLMN